MQRKHNGKEMTRKEFRKERAKKKRWGLIIRAFVIYIVRELIALLFKEFKFSD